MDDHCMMLTIWQNNHKHTTDFSKQIDLLKEFYISQFKKEW